jgi:hypothetical protein
VQCRVVCFATLVLLQGCAVVEAVYLAATAFDISYKVAADYEGGGPWNVQPVCQLQCVTTDAELTEIVTTTGLNTYGVKTCFAANDQSELSSIEYCEKLLSHYCKRAAEELSKENPLYGQCTVAQTSQCVDLGVGRFPECSATTWSPRRKRAH